MSRELENSIVIFCDGACSGNPGPGGWGSIVATLDGSVRELGGGERSTTNNKMELTAALEALQMVSRFTGPVSLYTDSTYLIRGITQWVHGWRRRGWKTAEGKDVANQDLWEALYEVVSKRGRGNPISWRYVRGHTGIPGNERCDVIAVEYSKGSAPYLYQGPLSAYSVDLTRLPENTDLPDMKSPSEPKAKAISYLSLIHNMPMRHGSWEECSRRVTGQSGAKFKKAMSREDELSILRSWGFSSLEVLNKK